MEEKDVLEFLKDSDNVKKLLRSDIKPKVVDYIRKSKLSEEVIDSLWEIENFRWSILRKQSLSEDRINSLIDEIVKKSIKKPLDIALGIVKYQKPKNYQIKNLTQSYISNSIVLEVWYMKPKEASENGDFNHFLEIIKDDSYLTKRGKNKFIKTINQVSRKTDKTNEILDVILSYESYSSMLKILNVLIRDNFIEDLYINKISSILKEEDFKDVAKILVHKNNCSVSMKAKLLLLK